MGDELFNKKLRVKKCKQCSQKFSPYTSLSLCCSVKCSLEYNKEKKKKAEVKEWLIKKMRIKEKLMSYSDWLKKLQKVFNQYIRKRDRGRLCICCDRPLGETFHAGHAFSVGAYPSLRFDEDNCFGQRVECNLHKHGNQAEYMIRLPKRIGQERFDQLLERRKGPPRKLSVNEIKDLIYYYKVK